MELSPGTEIADRYVLNRLIGEGGMGTVWAATDSQSGQDVALKFVKESGSIGKLRRRLLREAKAACAVRHPSVVQVHDILELDDGSPVMVMEYLQGESLAERLCREEELEVEDVCDILLPVVSAVGTAHSLGVVHRDLKPENIYLARGADGGQEVKILDFGIAKLAPSEQEAAQSTELTRTGSMLGTPCYMSPEQVYGERDIDHRTDIWALGMILYEALSGILPTRAENMGQVMKIITTRAIWPLQEAAPDLPEDLTDLVNQMLQRERSDRPKDLRQALEVLAVHSEVDVPTFGEPIGPVPLSSGRDSQPLGPKAIQIHRRARNEDGTQATTLEGEGTDSVEAVLAELGGQPRRSTKRLSYGLLGTVIVLLTVVLWMWAGGTAETSRQATSSVGQTAAAAAPADQPDLPTQPADDSESTPPSSGSATAAAGGGQPGRSDSPAKTPRPRPSTRVAVTPPKPTAEPTAEPKAPPAPTSKPSSMGGVVDTVPF